MISFQTLKHYMYYYLKRDVLRFIEIKQIFK